MSSAERILEFSTAALYARSVRMRKSLWRCSSTANRLPTELAWPDALSWRSLGVRPTPRGVRAGGRYSRVAWARASTGERHSPEGSRVAGTGDGVRAEPTAHRGDDAPVRDGEGVSLHSVESHSLPALAPCPSYRWVPGETARALLARRALLASRWEFMLPSSM